MAQRALRDPQNLCCAHSERHDAWIYLGRYEKRSNKSGRIGTDERITDGTKWRGNDYYHALPKDKPETPMKAIVMCGVLATVLLAGTDNVLAKGCIKGAIVGGVAGHYAGHHAMAGAAAGCVIGHHMAKKHEQERTNAEEPPAR